MFQVHWSNRFENRAGTPYKASVDGTDFRIMEPSPFDPKWFSHKFKGPGLRYEIAVGVGNGWIVWAHGPFACGAFNDLSIFRLGLKQAMNEGELIIADAGYIDPVCSHPNQTDGTIDFSYVRARHEALNKRLKQFAILGSRFRHDLGLHSTCFFAVLNLVQLGIQRGEVIFHS